MWSILSEIELFALRINNLDFKADLTP